MAILYTLRTIFRIQIRMSFGLFNFKIYAQNPKVRVEIVQINRLENC